MIRATSALLLTLTVLATGCTVARGPLPVVEPTFSIRDAEPTMAAADLWPSTESLRAADANTEPLAAVEGYEPSLLYTRLSTAELDGASDLLRVE